MAVNYFKPVDVYPIMNTLVQQITGQDTIKVVDTASYIDAGKSILGVANESGYEGVFNALSVLIGRTIIEARPYTGKFKLIDEEASTVYLADPQMSLDVGSIGKGFAVQRVAEYAKELGYENIVLNVGGNVCAVGSHVNGDNWRMGIQNPDLNASNQVIKRVAFSDNCLVTSGDYQRFYVVDDVEYCHIIDPDTLMPADYFKAVSIICNDSGLADALSTALFNMTYEEGLALISSLENAEAMWIFEDGSIKYSEHFEDYIVE